MSDSLDEGAVERIKRAVRLELPEPHGFVLIVLPRFGGDAVVHGDFDERERARVAGLLRMVTTNIIDPATAEPRKEAP